MGTRSKKPQPAASGAAATSDVNDSTEADANDSTESDEPSSSVQSGQPVTIEQISSLLQASQAALKADLIAHLKAEFQASQAAITSRLDTWITTLQKGLKEMQNEVKNLHQNEATELDPDKFDEQTAMLSIENAVKTEGRW